MSGFGTVFSFLVGRFGNVLTYTAFEERSAKGGEAMRSAQPCSPDESPSPGASRPG